MIENEIHDTCDYKCIAPSCQFGVPWSYNEDGVTDCGEPAIYKVWWDNLGKDFILVCQEHLDEILKQEKENE